MGVTWNPLKKQSEARYRKNPFKYSKSYYFVFVFGQTHCCFVVVVELIRIKPRWAVVGCRK